MTERGNPTGTSQPVAALPRASVRHLRGPAGAGAALVALIAASLAIHGSRLLGPPFVGGDLLYHGALGLAIVRGEFPPAGAYAGLPAYYPPGFHLLLAALMGPFDLSPQGAAAILFLIFLPVLPVTTFLLARRLTGRPWVAVLAVALTLFAGAYDLRPIRQWVNSLFVGGHVAYTEYPRDIVFAILPLAAYALVRALEPGLPGSRRWLGWAVAAGAILGGAALVQIQVALAIPLAFAVVAVVVAIRHRERRGRAIVVLLAAGGVALLIAAPWLLQMADAIRRNGGVALESSDQLEPARFGFWSYPREFGLVLPFGLVGAGAALLFLPRDGPQAGTTPWRPTLAEGGVLLVAWWLVPFALGVLYDPGWPLEDALRPQRLWLVASQPLAILAAIGLVTSAEHVLAGRRPAAIPAAVAAVVLVACLPATAATAVVVAGTWTHDAYAMLDRSADRVPHFADLLGQRGPRQTVVAPEDWSALVWYETGEPVVAFVPPGYAKLAFDPARFTPASQDARRAALVDAWSGDLGELVRVAGDFGAPQIVIPRDGDRWALLDLAAAAVALGDPATAQEGTVVAGNGWDALDLAAGGTLVLPSRVSGPLVVGVRVGRAGVDGSGTTRLRLLAAAAADAAGVAGPVRTLAEVEIGPSTEDWRRGSAAVTLAAGEHLVIEAVTPVRLQAVTGWSSAPGSPAGWRLATETPEAVVLERLP